jgi:NTP pyrophosphatase (non-canonical NTP hydrolase)
MSLAPKYEGGWNAIVGQKAKENTMGYGCQKEFHLNDFHRANYERQREAFAPPHPLMSLVACVQEEVGELAAAVLGVTGEKKRKAHLTNDDVLDAVADAMTYLSLVASNVGCMDLETLLAKTFNMVSDRAKSKIKVGIDG